jgi:hypothetical protein
MEILEKTKESVKETNKEIVSQALGMVSSAFVLVAALAWNDAIKDLITQYLKSDTGVVSRFVYAIIVTVIAVVITMRLNKIVQKFKDSEKQT